MGYVRYTKMSKIISIVSLKGGVGKTTTAINLGSSLSQDFNKKVLILDSNFSSPGVGLHFGVVNPENTVQDVLSNKTKINNAVYKINTGLYIMPANFLSKKVDMFTLKNKLNDLRQYYDYILLDTAPAINSSTITAISASDEALVVSNPDYLGLSATLRTVQLINQKQIPLRGIILNNVKNKSFELTKQDLEQASNAKIISTIPSSQQFSEAMINTTSLVLHNPKSTISKLYKDLAAKISETTVVKDPFKNKLKKLFKKSITQEEVEKLLIENEIK